MEGGGKVSLQTKVLPLEKPVQPMISQYVPPPSISSTIKEGIQAEREAKVSPRKGVSKIVPRKGVNETTIETDSPSQDSELNYQLKASAVQNKPKDEKLVTLHVEPQFNIVNKNSSETEVLQEIPIKKVKKHKLKPPVTIGGSNVDEPIPASPTKTPPLGMPRKIDYIIPVMITIFALPLLGIGTYILYRRGRDCWDKRHYRRMDFLIDGMYNE